MTSLCLVVVVVLLESLVGLAAAGVVLGGCVDGGRHVGFQETLSLEFIWELTK